MIDAARAMIALDEATNGLFECVNCALGALLGLASPHRTDEERIDALLAGSVPPTTTLEPAHDREHARRVALVMRMQRYVAEDVAEHGPLVDSIAMVNALLRISGPNLIDEDRYNALYLRLRGARAICE